MRPPRAPMTKLHEVDSRREVADLCGLEPDVIALAQPAGRSRKRSPSPTPHKRSSSLSRSGRDPTVTNYLPGRLRSLSPSITDAAFGVDASKQKTRDASVSGNKPQLPSDGRAGQQPTLEIREPAAPVPSDLTGAALATVPARHAAECTRRGADALLELERAGERLSGLAVVSDVQPRGGSGQPAPPPGKAVLSPMSAAGVSSRLRLTQNSAAQAGVLAGAGRAGSIQQTALGWRGASGLLGGGAADVRQAGRGITLRVGQVVALLLRPRRGFKDRGYGRVCRAQACVHAMR